MRLKRQKVLKYDTFTYVPLKSLLKQLLSNPQILDEVNKIRISKDGVLRDYCDGKFFKEHPVFQSDKRAIQLVAYYVEIELCNPLGSSNKKHKVGCLFLSLGNIHPSKRSLLSSMFLVAIGSSRAINKHGINKFLKVFVKDVNELCRDGIDIQLDNGKIEHYRVVVLAFLADNLGAHQLGDFKESMSFVFRICRSCMATKSNSQGNFNESNFVLRTEAEHRSQCLLLEGTSRL